MRNLNRWNAVFESALNKKNNGTITGKMKEKMA
jgi:hypothetical protein